MAMGKWALRGGSLLLALGLLAGLLIAGHAAETVDISAKAGLLMERETGKVLYEENAHEQLEPASVTKVMTMLLAAEALDRGALELEELVTVSAYAAGMGGSQVYLKEGEQMSVRDLLKAVAVASGNDAAVALAERLSGSEEAFVEEMNRRAGELGMEETHFCNCTGLPAQGHLTSAYDIALMSRALLGHEVIRQFTGIWMDTLRDGQFQLANTNKLIYYYEGATGLKTGSTDGAGYCISASALREDMELIAVVLGAETSARRFESAKALLNYGFGSWCITDAAPDLELPPVPVTLGETETVAVRLAQPARLLVKKTGREQVSTEVTLAETVQAPVRAGDPLGTLAVRVGEEIVGEIPLVAASPVEALTFGKIFRQILGTMAS